MLKFYLVNGEENENQTKIEKRNNSILIFSTDSSLAFGAMCFPDLVAAAFFAC